MGAGARPPLWGSGARSKGGEAALRPADRLLPAGTRSAAAASPGGGGGGDNQAAAGRRRLSGAAGGRAAPACGITRGPGGAERGDRGSP